MGALDVTSQTGPHTGRQRMLGKRGSGKIGSLFPGVTGLDNGPDDYPVNHIARAHRVLKLPERAGLGICLSGGCVSCCFGKKKKKSRFSAWIFFPAHFHHLPEGGDVSPRLQFQALKFTHFSPVTSVLFIKPSIPRLFIPSTLECRKGALVVIAKTETFR